MKKTLALVVSVAFLSSLLTSPAIGAVKAGASCNKAGIKSVSASKTFICLKKGKKLVWGKGEPNKVSSPTNPSASTSNKLPEPFSLREGGPCNGFEGKTFTNSKGVTLNCKVESDGNVHWISLSKPTHNQNPSSNSGTVPSIADGSKCNEVGAVTSINNAKFSCRYITGHTTVWVQISGSNDAPANVANNSQAGLCKISDQRTSEYTGGGNVGFPITWNSMKPNGTIKVAVLPINFTDSPKVTDPISYWKKYSDLIDQRNEYLYKNRIKYEWTIPSEWIVMPKTAQYFASDHVTVQADGSRKSDGVVQLLSSDEQASMIFSEAEKTLKIRDYDFFWIFTNPLETRVPQGPMGRLSDVRTNTTTYENLNFYMLGNRLYSGAFHLGPIGTLQDTIAHEMGHFHGLIQHAPGNGWGWYVSNNPTWEAWLAGWRPDSEYLCFDTSQNWENVNFNLSAIDLNSKGYKSGVIKISNSEVLVVESRRPGPFTTALPKWVSGITAYVVDTKKSGERWDGNIDKEPDYYMTFLRNENRSYPIFRNQELSVWDENILAYQGDSFAYKGVKITLKKSGDYDSISVSKMQK